MLAPLALVSDKNDNGSKDDDELGDGSGQLLGDHYIRGSSPYTQDLSAMDTTNDGCVELPLVADPSDPSIIRCDPTLPSALGKQATKRQVIRWLVTHELGHAIGGSTHTQDQSDIMAQYRKTWLHDDHFSQTFADGIVINNRQ